MKCPRNGGFELVYDGFDVGECVGQVLWLEGRMESADRIELAVAELNLDLVEGNAVIRGGGRGQSRS